MLLVVGATLLATFMIWQINDLLSVGDIVLALLFTCGHAAGH